MIAKLCPKVEKALEMISKRWTGLIIYQLLNGPQRFCEIESSIPISGRLLSERLKELEKAGIVSRKVYAEVPVRVEYTLTEKGMALEKVMNEISIWANKYIEEDKEDLNKQSIKRA